MKKKKQMLGLAVATTVAVFGQDVQAEEIITANSPTEAEAISATTSTETVTAQDVADAKALVDEASKQVQVVEELISVTETALAKEQEASQETATSLAQAEALTDETLATAQEAIQSAQEAKESAQEAVTASQAEKASLEQAVEAQTSVVTTATTEVDSAEATVKATEGKIVALEGNGVADVEKLQGDVATLETTVASDEVAVANAQSSLDNAKEASSNREVAVANQQGVVASAEAQVDSTAKAYADAISAKEATSNALATAKSTLDTAKNGTQVTETVKVGETTTTTGGKATLNDGVATSEWYESNGVLTNKEYLTAIKNLANGTGTVEEVKNAIKYGYFGMTDNNLDDLHHIAAPNATKLASWKEAAQYTFSDTDATTLVDVISLTKEQRTDLANFYVALVNDLRSELGTPLLVVTDESVETSYETNTAIFNKLFPYYAGMTLEEKVANGFWGATFSKENHLTTTGYTSIYKVVSSTTGENLILGWLTGNYGQYDKNDGRKQTMADLKANILATLGVQLYGILGDGSMGEVYGGMNGTRTKDFEIAMTVLGLNDKGKSYNAVGVDLPFLEVFNGMIHRAPQTFITFTNTTDTPVANPYQTTTGGTTTVTPIYDTVTRTVVDETKVAEAQNAYNVALANDNSAQTTLDSTKTAYEAAQTAYAEAQAQLNAILAGTTDITSLETALNNAVAKLEADKVALQSAKEVLALAKASNTDKAVALEAAKVELGTAQTVLAEKQALLRAEEAKLASLKADLASKETAYQTALAQLAETNSALETAKAELAKLETLVAQKPALVEALAISKAKVAELEALLKEQKATKVEVADALAQAQTAYALVKAEYDFVLELERLSVDNTVAVLEDGTVIAVPKDAPTAPVLPSISLEDWLKAQEAEIVASGQVAIPLVNKAGQVIGYEAQAVVKPQAPVAPASKGQASLPNTGQASNLLLFVGLGTLGLAVGVRRKGE
ncbi:SEC10/PgrA surface exclusion domain-containing protein [Streptococcus suis]|nr:SEC10/PgrA surface exclusion domain-containing protein [Streptococcus suis]NQJ77130.1 SEC10/PgrA surface exclusion domain-containing protein [Streptococcus suis]